MTQQERIIERQPITDELIRVLGDATTFPVGDHEVPAEILDDEGRVQPDKYPYHIVYSVPGGERWGPMKHPDQNAGLVYNVTTVGLTRQQAEAGADRARNAIVGRRSRRGADGRRGFLHRMTGVADRTLDNNGGLDWEGLPPNRIYSYAETFTLHAVV